MTGRYLRQASPEREIFREETRSVKESADRPAGYLFLDIDGTLYSPLTQKTPASAVQAIRAARANGWKVFLCTGRTLAECAAYLDFPTDGFIFASGAMIYAEGTCIYDHPIHEWSQNQIIRRIHQYEMGFSRAGAAGSYCDALGYQYLTDYFSGGEQDPEKRRSIAAANGCYPASFRDQDDRIYKIGCFGKREADFLALQNEMPRPYQLTISMQDPRTGTILAEITDGTLSKAAAIRSVLDQYHADWQDAAAIGDSENDISMIRSCGIGIAMGNAAPQVRASADWVTADILDGGILKALVYIGAVSAADIDAMNTLTAD